MKPKLNKRKEQKERPQHLFQPGRKKTGGRKKGTPNKVTTSMKQALYEAFNGTGGVDQLIAWARQPRNRGEFYRLCARLIPTEIVGADGGPIKFSQEERESLRDKILALHEQTPTRSNNRVTH